MHAPSRRDFFTSAASGVGVAALASLLRDDGRVVAADAVNPLAPKKPQFAPKAKACICIYLEGAPSQLDLWDPKPKLNDLHGEKLPDSLLEKVRFAFIQKEGARLLGSPRKWAKAGRCGIDLSDFLPHLAGVADEIAWLRGMHTDAFNHHPGQLLMNTGSSLFGRPSIGSWLLYGLGSECNNLPGYVVLNSGRGTSGGTSNWSSGFLASTYQGVLFRNQGDPVLNLSNPPGLDAAMQGKTIDALRDLNTARAESVGDPEIQSRIAAYELAFQMQSAAPELIDLKGETKQTLEMYGVGRQDGSKSGRGGPAGTWNSFSSNCLLARRLVERGVRFVSLFHASWDHHSNLDAELGYCAGMADQPVAALIKDLKQRGLLDSTLVLWMSEFGRTPLGENRGGSTNVTGRDHHPYAFTLWGAGGGLKGGTVLGKTDEIGWGVVEDPVHVNDWHATILHLFGFDHEKLTYRFQGRDFRLTDVAGKVVRKVLA